MTIMLGYSRAYLKHFRQLPLGSTTQKPVKRADTYADDFRALRNRHA
jgi:hypothetical protein